MLIELAIGDAYGAGFEYVRDRRFITRHNDLSGYVKHSWHDIKPGCYTDDTQMSLAIAELIVEGADWTPEVIAGKFVEVFHRDPRRGYSGHFYKFLKRTRTGADFLKNIRPDSDKSGAAMRAGPIGVFASIDEVLERSRIQAELTHNTPDGVRAAQAAALMTHYFLNDLGPKSGLPEFLCTHVPGAWRESWSGEVGSKGWMSVRAAIKSLMKHETLSGLLKSSIAWGGDVDTVATIALAAGSCSKEIEPDLPEVLVRNLENKAYGRDYLLGLDVLIEPVKKRL